MFKRLQMSGRAVATFCAAVLMATATGCSGDDDVAADRRAKELREATCEDLAEDVRRLTVSRVESLIWDNKLYKTDNPVPEDLLDSAGRPVPFDEMTDNQRSTYIEWKNGTSGAQNLAWMRTAREKLDAVEKSMADLDVRDRCIGG